jgi:hypothetical protein
VRTVRRMRYSDPVESEKRYGKLRVLGVANRATAASGHKYYRCVCDCGTEIEVRGTHLRQGRTTSCGCSRRGARAGIENFRSRCKAVTAAATAMASARWAKPDVDRDQPRRAGALGGRPAAPGAPANAGGKAEVKGVCARCGWEIQPWQIPEQHERMCVLTHSLFPTPAEARADIFKYYAQVLAKQNRAAPPPAAAESPAA